MVKNVEDFDEILADEWTLSTCILMQKLSLPGPAVRLLYIIVDFVTCTDGRTHILPASITPLNFTGMAQKHLAVVCIAIWKKPVWLYDCFWFTGITEKRDPGQSHGYPISDWWTQRSDTSNINTLHSFRYDEIHLIASPQIPNLPSCLQSSILWSTVSKAVLTTQTCQTWPMMSNLSNLSDLTNDVKSNSI